MSEQNPRFTRARKFSATVTGAILISTGATLTAGQPAVAAVQGHAPAAISTAEPRTGIYDNICAGQPEATRVQSFTDKFGSRFPVRCGTLYGYGYLKIAAKHGPWNQAFEGQIVKTITAPDIEEPQGTSKMFLTKQLNGIYFKVVVEYGKYSDGDPKGIITAFQGSVVQVKR